MSSNQRLNLRSGFKDIIRENRGDKVSSTQVWFNITNLIVTIMYILIGVAVYRSATPNIMDYGIFTAIYAGIVTGNKMMGKFLSYKYTAGPPSPTEQPATKNTKSTNKKVIDKDVVTDN